MIDASAAMTSPVLEVTNLKKHFPIRKGFLGLSGGQVKAVDGVSFSIGPGETSVARTPVPRVSPRKTSCSARAPNLVGA